MLDIQRERLIEMSRLRADGASEDEVAQLRTEGKKPFRPAYQGGERRKRKSEIPTGTFEVPTGQFTMPRKS
jgi:hypothetical protein